MRATMAPEGILMAPEGILMTPEGILMAPEGILRRRLATPFAVYSAC